MIGPMRLLPFDFFNQPTLDVARGLIGQLLIFEQNGHRCSGIISETEAYTEEDPACHAFGGRKTARNAVMFEAPGTIYIYRIYGMHHCLNVVTEERGRGCAVLIRGCIPVDGIQTMKQRRLKAKTERDLTNGPAKLVSAFGLSPNLNGCFLSEKTDSGKLEIESYLPNFEFDIRETPRIGISKAKSLPWRFVIGNLLQ